MNYHNIDKDNMLNGDGIRVVLWLAGCEHHCPECQNPQTHDPNGGIPFDDAAMDEIKAELSKDYVSGVTLSGGDPLHPYNRFDVSYLCETIKKLFPDKTIWCYTGYTYESMKVLRAMNWIDVLVDGRYLKDKRDVNAHWVGSTNQRVIDVKKTRETGNIVLWEDKPTGEVHQTGRKGCGF